jgi:glucose-6-phosphate 1-dehydrogenase
MIDVGTGGNCDLLIIGGEGDLALRKLYPALFALWEGQCLCENVRIVALARKSPSRDEFLVLVKQWFDDYNPGGAADTETWGRFIEHLHYFPADATSAEALTGLQTDHFSDPERGLVVYLATPPQIFAPVCRALQGAGLVRPSTRIVVEKPLGSDLESFREINRELTSIFVEEQVYRIDHYLGKETVQNLLALRFANSVIEPLWNNRYVDNVQITVAENIGVSGRWSFYDEAGAMRDMLQNHLLQLLSLAAMEPPAHLSAEDVRNEKVKVLSCLRPMTDSSVRDNTVIGQYTAGAVGGEAVVGYMEEEGAEKSSDTETFVALKAEIDNWRWAGVPFYLRTGKRMQQRLAEIVVEFKQVPHSIFGPRLESGSTNRMVITLQPDEIISLELMNKQAGLDVALPLQQVSLDLTFPEQNEREAPDAYQRLLLDVIRQNPTLFVRADEVEAAWTWVDGIRAAWSRLGMRPKNYSAGSWGPSESIALVARDNRSWYEAH